MKSGKLRRSEALDILLILTKSYPDIKSELTYQSTFQLLVGTLLAAQATDKKVNEVTEKLYSDYKTPEDFLQLSQEELENKIREIHFCRVKAKHILDLCRTLVHDFGGVVPDNREDLMKLAGVGRKTANVILSYAFGKPAIAVDTHVFRVAGRLGLTSAEDVLEAELDMQKLIPEALWSRAHSSMVLHGRRICAARNPKCGECVLALHCRFNRKKAG